MKIVVATNNEHKLEEISAILTPRGFEIFSQKEIGLSSVDVEETGTTFTENSLIKAKTISKLSGMASIADDSGLEVYSLGGEPGVYSARYSGASGARAYIDEKNNDKLLFKLAKLAQARRDEQGYVVDKGDCSARYVSVITLYIPPLPSHTMNHALADTVIAEGICEGAILPKREGSGGFGYDPLFLPDGQSQTFAQMSQEDKNKISHRAKALALLQQKLDRIGNY